MNNIIQTFLFWIILLFISCYNKQVEKDVKFNYNNLQNVLPKDYVLDRSRELILKNDTIKFEYFLNSIFSKQSLKYFEKDNLIEWTNKGYTFRITYKNVKKNKYKYKFIIYKTLNTNLFGNNMVFSPVLIRTNLDNIFLLNKSEVDLFNQTFKSKRFFNEMINSKN